MRSRPRNWSHVLEAGNDCSALLRQLLLPRDCGATSFPIRPKGEAASVLRNCTSHAVASSIRKPRRDFHHEPNCRIWIGREHRYDLVGDLDEKHFRCRGRHIGRSIEGFRFRGWRPRRKYYYRSRLRCEACAGRRKRGRRLRQSGRVHGRRWSWSRFRLVCVFVDLSRLRLDQEQRVVEDDVATTKGKALELAIGLAIGCAKKVLTGRAGADRQRQNLSCLEARHVKIAQGVFKEPGRAREVLPALTIKLLELCPQVDRRPSRDHQLIVGANSLDLAAD